MNLSLWGEKSNIPEIKTHKSHSSTSSSAMSRALQIGRFICKVYFLPLSFATSKGTRCGKLPTNAFTTITYNDSTTEVGTSADISCTFGYRLNRKTGGVALCPINGQWHTPDGALCQGTCESVGVKRSTRNVTSVSSRFQERKISKPG